MLTCVRVYCKRGREEQYTQQFSRCKCRTYFHVYFSNCVDPSEAVERHVYVRSGRERVEEGVKVSVGWGTAESSHQGMQSSAGEVASRLFYPSLGRAYIVEINYQESGEL